MANMHQVMESLRVAYGADLILCYATGDRQPVQYLSTAIATDTIDHFREILSSRGRQGKIMLAVMTNGGHLEAPWPIISLIRDYCDELVFVVLEKSLSAGTLMALGADTIVMNPGSYISPIDPNKQKNENGQITSIEVEDVIGYIDLIKDRIGTDSPEAAKSVIDHLTQQIPPTELGSIYRTHALIRMLSEKMLNLHKTKLESTKIKNVVKNLTEQLFSHNHLISRKEARDDIGFGEVIEYPSAAIEKKIRELSKKLHEVMQLDSPLNPKSALGKAPEKQIEAVRAIVSDGTTTYSYKSKIIITANPQNVEQPIVNFTDQGWVKG